ncbi:MarR family winged helix-turn-helix transcriptional regulator [Clostridium intestinale]|uniref:MarR family transcriptional regulator n=1 Tax=Clostridium intestinale URNW TaxID=1294142 RepID=U2Q7W0_9CLOT|nr:MarR family transcriptional regulator [Clostridium intestinale]ERK32264.1 MarR family transcriptional regulator [Clostridium intestinale URNW]
MYREISVLFSKFLDKYNNSIEKKLKEENFIGLGASHFAILIGIIFSKEKRLCMKEIASFINKDKSTVTQLVNKLIRYDLIEKKYSESDKRMCYMMLSNKGRENEALFIKIYNESEAENNMITVEERQSIENIVKKLIISME